MIFKENDNETILLHKELFYNSNIYSINNWGMHGLRKFGSNFEKCFEVPQYMNFRIGQPNASRKSRYSYIYYYLNKINRKG